MATAIHQPIEGRNPDIKLVRLIWDAAHLILLDFTERAASYDLTLVQWRILSELDRREGWTQSELARQLEAEKVTIGRELERLEAAKLIRRDVDPADARVRRVYRTASLIKLYREFDALMESTYEAAFSGIGGRQRALLEKTLTTMVNRLQDVSRATGR